MLLFFCVWFDSLFPIYYPFYILLWAFVEFSCQTTSGNLCILLRSDQNVSYRCLSPILERRASKSMRTLRIQFQFRKDLQRFTDPQWVNGWTMRMDSLWLIYNQFWLDSLSMRAKSAKKKHIGIRIQQYRMDCKSKTFNPNLAPLKQKIFGKIH